MCTTDGTLQSDKSESILPLKEGALVALMLLLLLLLLLFGLVDEQFASPVAFSSCNPYATLVRYGGRGSPAIVALAIL